MGNIHGRRVRHYHYHHSKRSSFRSSNGGEDVLSTSSSIRSSFSSTRPQQPYVFGTLCLNSYVDVGKALMDCNSKKKILIPRKIQVGAKFLNTMTNFPTTHHKRSLRRVLRRGCIELELIGMNPRAPRRVYETEIVFVLERLQHEMIECLHIENIDIQQPPGQLQPLQPLQQVGGDGGHKLLENLKKLTNLQRIVIKSCRMSTPLLQDLLQALRKLPQLQEVTLNLLDLQQHQPQEQQQEVAIVLQQIEATISILIQTNKIVKLSLPTYPKRMDLWKQIIASPNIQSLSLSCHNTGNDVDLSWIERLLLLDNTNTTSRNNLKSLELRSSSCTTNKMEPLITGLKDNTTLEELSITMGAEAEEEGNGGDDIGAIATTTTRSSELLLKQLIPIMKNHNFTLSKFELYQEEINGGDDTNVRTRISTPIIDFYTQLNQRKQQHLHNNNSNNNSPTYTSLRGCSVCCHNMAGGRSYLLRDGQPTREEWKQVLMDAATKADVSTLYYWLRVQPTLITTTMTTTTTNDDDDGNDENTTKLK